MSINKTFTSGFNNGYLLTKYEPNLLSQLVRNLHITNEYFHGFFPGKEEFEQERTRNTLDELKSLREQSFGRENGLERDE